MIVWSPHIGYNSLLLNFFPATVITFLEEAIAMITRWRPQSLRTTLILDQPQKMWLIRVLLQSHINQWLVIQLSRTFFRLEVKRFVVKSWHLSPIPFGILRVDKSDPRLIYMWKCGELLDQITFALWVSDSQDTKPNANHPCLRTHHRLPPHQRVTRVTSQIDSGCHSRHLQLLKSFQILLVDKSRGRLLAGFSNWNFIPNNLCVCTGYIFPFLLAKTGTNLHQFICWLNQQQRSDFWSAPCWCWCTSLDF